MPEDVSSKKNPKSWVPTGKSENRKTQVSTGQSSQSSTTSQTKSTKSKTPQSVGNTVHASQASKKAENQIRKRSSKNQVKANLRQAGSTLLSATKQYYLGSLQSVIGGITAAGGGALKTFPLIINEIVDLLPVVDTFIQAGLDKTLGRVLNDQGNKAMFVGSNLMGRGWADMAQATGNKGKAALSLWLNLNPFLTSETKAKVTSKLDLNTPVPKNKKLGGTLSTKTSEYEYYLYTMPKWIIGQDSWNANVQKIVDRIYGDDNNSINNPKGGK